MDKNQVKKKKFIIIYSDRHDSYGLFDDLKHIENVQLLPIHEKKIRNSIVKKIRRLHLSRAISTKIHLPLKYLWYEKPNIEIEKNSEYYILLVDIVLFSVSIKYINSLLDRCNGKCILLMLNSVKTDAIKQIKKELCSIHWDSVFTYDDEDAETYGFNKIGYCYYSKHNKEDIEKKYNKKCSDAYFVGTMKGSRKNQILSMYKFLKENGLCPEFHLMKTIKEQVEKLPFEDEIDYFTSDKGLIPYEEILASVVKTNIIIEIVQEGQTGPTLRYYEAVCYNKKLLTNNRHIVSFPMYDAQFMKIYDTLESIDIKWLFEDMDIDYHYNGEFSPKHILEKIANNTIPDQIYNFTRLFKTKRD